MADSSPSSLSPRLMDINEGDGQVLATATGNSSSGLDRERDTCDDDKSRGRKDKDETRLPPSPFHRQATRGAFKYDIHIGFGVQVIGTKNAENGSEVV